MNTILIIILLFPLALFSQTKMGIDEVIKIAVENNQSIKSGKLNIEKENAAKLKSFNIPKPELFIEYEGVQGSLSNAEERKIGIRQDMEFPSIYFLRADVHASQISIAREELNSRINDLKAEIKLNYCRLLLLNGLLIASKDNLKVFEDFLFTAEKKYEAGAASNLEVLETKVNKIKFENGIRNLESEIKSAQSEMRNLMNAGYEIMPADERVYKQTALNKTELLTNALRNNPDLKILKYQKEKFSEKISLSKGSLLPDISLKYFQQQISGDNNYWGMEIGLGVPLWFWGEQSGSIKESGYELQIASGEESALERSIENEINKAFEDYENSTREVDFFKEEAVRETDEILRQAKISYDEGAIGYVEYLQALNLAYETKIQYLNSIFNFNSSVIKLEKLTAGELK